MKIIKINNINYTTSIVMEIQKKDEFLKMLGEGRIDEDGDKTEAYVFELDKGCHIEYYGFSEDVTYIYLGDWDGN